MARSRVEIRVDDAGRVYVRFPNFHSMLSLGLFLTETSVPRTFLHFTIPMAKDAYYAEARDAAWNYPLREG